MIELESILLHITENAIIIGEKLQDQKSAIDRLNAEVFHLSRENEELNRKILNLIEESEVSRQTSFAAVVPKLKMENIEAKEKINELVKEIDKCIALLNN
jgi:predicted  nucleic acid-binding Zn-ribbon protein